MKTIKNFTYLIILAIFFCCNSCAPYSINKKESFPNQNECVSFINPQTNHIENPTTRIIVFEETFKDGQFSPDGSLFATVGINGLKIYSFVNKEPFLIQERKFLGHIEFVRWSPDGKLVALGSTDKYLYLYDIDKQEITNWRNVGSYHAPYMEWSSDGRYIFTLTGSPFFDPENVIGRLYESEGLRFVKEYYYPKEQIGFQTPLTFDWDRDNPEEANVLIRTNYDFLYLDGENEKSTSIKFNNILPNFYTEAFWIGQKNFLALNYYSKEESVIFISDGEVKKITSAQISSDINDRGNIYKGTLNRSNNLLVSFGGPGILFHCIDEGELIYLGAINYPDYHFSDRIIVNWATKNAYVHKYQSNELIHFDLSDILN